MFLFFETPCGCACSTLWLVWGPLVYLVRVTLLYDDDIYTVAQKVLLATYSTITHKEESQSASEIRTLMADPMVVIINSLNRSQCCSKSGQISRFLLAKWRRQKKTRPQFFVSSLLMNRTWVSLLRSYSYQKSKRKIVAVLFFVTPH